MVACVVTVMPNRHVNSMRRLTWVRRKSFTLVELLAVVVVIALLMALVIGVSSYVRVAMARSSARAQIGAMAAALEAYKADWGYYPRTIPARLSADGAKEATNNWYLYRALSGATGKPYMHFPAALIQLNGAPNRGIPWTNFNNGVVNTNFWFSAGVTNIIDPWHNPYVYYNSPTTPFSLVSFCTNLPQGTVQVSWSIGNYTLGGQVNVTTYDLFSFGPDGYTWVPYVTATGPTAWGNRVPGGGTWQNSYVPWTMTNSAADDINNWSR